MDRRKGGEKGSRDREEIFAKKGAALRRPSMVYRSSRSRKAA